MPKSSDSSDDVEVDAEETTNISPNVQNYCKRTFRWVSLLYAEIAEISFNPAEDAQLLKKLENILAALDDEEDIMKSLTTIDVSLKKVDVEEKLKKSRVTTPPNPKRHKTAPVRLPICKSKGVEHTMQNIIKFVSLFEMEAVYLRRKSEFGSADVSKIDELEVAVNVCKDYLMKTREKLKILINKMKAKVSPSDTSTSAASK